MKHYGIDNHPADSRVTLSQDGIMQTLSSRMGTGGGNTPMILTDKENNMEDEIIVRRLNPLECERLQGFPDNWTLIGEPRQKLVKDYRTFWKLGTSENGEPSIEVTKKEQIGSHYETVYVWKDSKGKEHECTDSARYMALGNSLALPQWWWLVNRLKRVLPEGATLASLFDGIGGFPLVWEETFGKGTAVWASEIEEFPIAVTMEHFKED